MGERCANTWVCLAITFIGISITLVGIICWREFILKDKETDTRITRENLIKYYPTIYGIYTTNISYEQILLKGANRLTPTTGYFNPNKNCSFDCVPNGGKRISEPNYNRARVYNHACCQSTRIFTTHQFFTNIDGVVREIVQFNDSLLLIYMPQVFFQEECRQAIHCTGCICHYIAQATSAVVYKSGYTSATARYISQLEIDLFYLHGCCKCINLSKRAP
ncbi:uncharacterized protein LOC127718916 isoform X1 [Mytilus californianus]|uniref:uncharacterized protein LOC127718916 isoform X1 n=1 Tax=Mytilus californianus TaxID=6549 RepID=UPI002247DECA|nr:uncharacterized protein LOC127718916 isoform X1 [Mytilus californianus]